MDFVKIPSLMDLWIQVIFLSTYELCEFLYVLTFNSYNSHVMRNRQIIFITQYAFC